MGDELKCLKEGVCTFLGVQAYFQVIVVLKRCWNHFGLWIGSQGLIPSFTIDETLPQVTPKWLYTPSEIIHLPTDLPEHCMTNFFDYLALFPNILMPNVCSISACSMHIWEVGGFGMRLSYTTHHNNATSPSHTFHVSVYTGTIPQCMHMLEFHIKWIIMRTVKTH